MPDKQSELLNYIREFVAEHSGKSTEQIPQFTADHDLFENGDLDSFGFVELLSFLGDRTGTFLDLSDVDPAELSTVGSLISHFGGAEH